MTVVPRDGIERIVGVARDTVEHIGRAVSAESTIYVLHSRACIDDLASHTSDIRECRFARAQASGIDSGVWEGFMDRPVALRISSEWGDIEPAETAT